MEVCKDPAHSASLKQYVESAARHLGSMLFFDLGDHFELYFDDAETVGRLCGVTVSRETQTPTCKIPTHQIAIYFAKLKKLGVRLAIVPK